MTPDGTPYVGCGMLVDKARHRDWANVTAPQPILAPAPIVRYSPVDESWFALLVTTLSVLSGSLCRLGRTQASVSPWRSVPSAAPGMASMSWLGGPCTPAGLLCGHCGPQFVCVQSPCSISFLDGHPRVPTGPRCQLPRRGRRCSATAALDGRHPPACNYRLCISQRLDGLSYVWPWVRHLAFCGHASIDAPATPASTANARSV